MKYKDLIHCPYCKTIKEDLHDEYSDSHARRVQCFSCAHFFYLFSKAQFRTEKIEDYFGEVKK